MCLYINKHQKSKIAAEDIACYKYVRLNANDVFLTPYRQVIVEVGHSYISALGRRSSNIYQNFDIIEEGLHSFCDIGSVQRVVSRSIREKNNVIIKCIIPAGSEYYVGEFEEEYAYASNEIKYVEIVN